MEANKINRFINILFSEMGLKNLKYIEQLDSLFNADIDIEDKSYKVDDLLHNMVINDLKIEKLKSLLITANPELQPEIKQQANE